MALTPHGRREAEIDQAFHESNVRRVIKLVDSYGLSAGDRFDLADELRRRAATAVDDEARVRGVADVWRESALLAEPDLPVPDRSR